MEPSGPKNQELLRISNPDKWDYDTARVMFTTEEPLPPKDGAVPNLGTSSNSSTDYKGNDVPANCPASPLESFSSPHPPIYLITHNLPNHDTPEPGHEKTGKDTFLNRSRR
jgi:hypothetical protein